MDNKEELDKLIDEFTNIENEKIQTKEKTLENCKVIDENKAKSKSKIFEKYQIKDIVFLAIVSAIMLLSGGLCRL